MSKITKWKREAESKIEKICKKGLVFEPEANPLTFEHQDFKGF